MNVECFKKASELNTKISRIKSVIRLMEEPKCETKIVASQGNMNLCREYMPGPGTIEFNVPFGNDLHVAICDVLRGKLKDLESEFESL